MDAEMTFLPQKISNFVFKPNPKKPQSRGGSFTTLDNRDEKTGRFARKGSVELAPMQKNLLRPDL